MVYICRIIYFIQYFCSLMKYQIISIILKTIKLKKQIEDVSWVCFWKCLPITKFVSKIKIK